MKIFYFISVLMATGIVYSWAYGIIVPFNFFSTCFLVVVIIFGYTPFFADTIFNFINNSKKAHLR
ncbi:MAG: hypothetical protein WCI41_01315 [bacterium]